MAIAIQGLLESRKVELDVDDVYYGDQNNLPHAWTIVVQASQKNRALAGVAAPGGVTMNEMIVNVYLYCAQTGPEETLRFVVDSKAEQIEEILHEDTTMGGIIIHGFVTDIEHGVVFKPNSQYRAVLLTYRGRTKTYLTQ
ncbi:MAG: hypothetical protein ABW007_27525 [Chitinophagaceae bacterium]